MGFQVGDFLLQQVWISMNSFVQPPELHIYLALKAKTALLCR
jgi:hypothetical protein